MKSETIYKISQIASVITPYRGERDPKVINDYMLSCRDLFNGNPEYDKLLIRMLVKDEARTWLRVCQEKSEWLQLTGPDVLDQLKAIFFPANYEDAAIHTIWKLNRGSNSLSSYLEQFTELQQIIPAEHLTDAELYVFITEGCGEPFATDLRRYGITNFPDLLEYLQRQADMSAADFYIKSLHPTNGRTITQG